MGFRRELLLLLACVSCGPGRLLGSEESTSTSSSTSETESESESGESGEPADTGESLGTDETGTDSTGFMPPILETLVEDCDPWNPDCPDGEKCVPYTGEGGAWEGNKCVPVLGDQATGEPCTFEQADSTDNCDATGFCWEQTCHAFCMGSPEMPECPEFQVCPISSEGTIALCFPLCDPVVQDCEQGMGCYFNGTDFFCIPTAEPTIPSGEPCEFVNSCEVGSVCIDATLMPDCMGTGCCGEFCDLELGDAQCAGVPGTSCVPFWEQNMAPPGFEHVGVCILPP
jgi:hypothetical protein